jgi:foldase protein PrsA
MTSPRRPAALVTALLVMPLTLAACGGDGGVPSDAVIKIGSDTIAKATFDHAFRVAVKNQATQAGATGAAAVPDPPNFTRCIAQKRATAAKPAKGQPQPTAATFKAQCQQEYSALREQTMQSLISSAWIEGEAADRGVKLSDAEVKRDFDKQRAQNFPTDAGYLKYLKQSGSNQEDLLYNIKIQELTDKLHAKVSQGADKVTSAQVASYYNKNKRAFATGESRDYRVVLSKTTAKAEQVKAMLSRGQSWKTVAAKYSLDKGTSASGGLLPAVPKGQMVKSLDEATFSAKEGVIGGPVKTPAGYIIFMVEKITPARQQSLKETAASIKQQLISQQKQTKLDAFDKDFQKKWKDRTECQKGYAVPSCKNAPKVKPTSAVPSGTATTGAGSASGGATTNK